MSLSTSFVGVLCLSLLVSNVADTADSEWVRQGPDGRLVYKTTSDGDQIMDFSYAGYGGGGVALPTVGVAMTLSASGGDDTDAIQTAIDRVSALPEPSGALHAILLRAGEFHLSRVVSLPSGVVLRGEGDAVNQTVLVLTGSAHTGLSIGHKISETSSGPSVPVTDTYSPSGAAFVHLSSTTAFKPGDQVRITAPVTPAWVHFMGMDTLTRDGKPETWLSGQLSAIRTISSVRDGGVGLTPPLSHAYDSRYFGRDAVRLTKVKQTGLAEQVGLENLRIVAPPQHVTLTDPSFTGLSIDGVKDFWVHNVSIIDTTNDVEVGRDASRGTFRQVTFRHSVSIIGDAKPFVFSLTGTQILIDRCAAQGDNIWYVATNRDVQGPNVVLNSYFEGNGAVEPHQRWATGLLVDNVNVPHGGVSFQNRGELGSGHGWTTGWSVSWNNRAAWFLIQNPPGALNWSIGDRGQQREAPMPTFSANPDLSDEPQGIIEQPDRPVSPKSLYLAQLKERLGSQGLRAINY